MSATVVANILVRSRNVCVALGLLVACGPNGGKGGGGGGTGGSGDIDGGGGGGGGGGDVDASGGGGGGGGPDAMACASMPHKAAAAPLDMFIMLDQSGSMKGTKWTSVTGGLKTFVQQPNLDGFSVGIQYFGIAGTCPATCAKDADCGVGNLCLGNACLCLSGLGDSCNPADYAKPDVEIAALPGAAGGLVSSINAHAATTGTPTSAALQGAIDHSKAWAQAHPSDVVVAVLATDGEPEACDTDLTHINAIAAAGFNGTPKIPTFVIGVGSSLGNLNGIAAAGGTTSAFIVDTTGNIGQQFLDALNAIRGNALGCRYSIPVPTVGSPDYANVSVTYTPTGGAAKPVPHVTTMAGCPASGLGWYYDDNAAPTQIILCTSSCGTVSADKTGEVDIFTPCAVVVN
jgi:hypothetical protein